jgi:hypothetical protein
LLYFQFGFKLAQFFLVDFVATSATWLDFSNNQGMKLELPLLCIAYKLLELRLHYEGNYLISAYKTQRVGLPMFTLLILLCFLWWQVQIQLLADLNLKKTPQLLELVDDSNVVFFFLLFDL